MLDGVRGVSLEEGRARRPAARVRLLSDRFVKHPALWLDVRGGSHGRPEVENGRVQVGPRPWDGHGPEVDAKFGTAFGIPIFCFTQLVVLALGAAPEEVGLGRHLFNPRPLLPAAG